jgi:hypothetical protein
MTPHAIPYFHQSEPSNVGRSTTRAGRMARPVYKALPGTSPEARRDLERWANDILAAEPISPVPSSCDRAVAACDSMSDGRRRTSQSYEAEGTWDASRKAKREPRRAAIPVYHGDDALAASAIRRAVDASITPALAEQLRTWAPTRIAEARAAGFTPAAEARRRGILPQLDPWQCESAFLARTFAAEVLVGNHAATTAALDGAPLWLTQSVLDEALIDGVRPEAIARRLGVTGKTVRKHLKRAGDRLADYYAASDKPDVREPVKVRSAGDHKAPSRGPEARTSLDTGPTPAYRQAQAAAAVRAEADEQSNMREDITFGTTH